MYGLPYLNLKKKFWVDLHSVGTLYSGPWLLIGDFNTILSQNEKRDGRSLGSTSKASHFKQFIQNHGLIDLGFENNPFTWTNGRQGFANIQEHIDRSVANALWRQMYPKAFLKHLLKSSSNHTPFFLILRAISIALPNH